MVQPLDRARPKATDLTSSTRAPAMTVEGPVMVSTSSPMSAPPVRGWLAQPENRVTTVRPTKTEYRRQLTA